MGGLKAETYIEPLFAFRVVESEDVLLLEPTPAVGALILLLAAAATAFGVCTKATT